MKMSYKTKINFILVMLISSVISAAIHAEEDLKKSSWLEKFTGKTIVIENPYGNVRLRYGGKYNALEYVAVAQNLEANSNLAIKIDRTKSNSIKFLVVNEISINKELEKKSRLDVTFFIPKDKNIYIITKNGLIEAKGLIANIEAESVGGNISLNKIKGSLQTITESGETKVIITQLASNVTQKFISSTGDVNVLINRKSHYLVEVSTSSDIISDFSMEIKNLYNQEPNKKGIIKLNKEKSIIIITSKRGNTAIKGFGEN